MPKPRALVPLLLLPLLPLLACGQGEGASSVVDSGAASAADAAPDAASQGAADAATDGVAVDGSSASRCTMTADTVTCPLSTLAVTASPGVTRNVHYQVPLGAPPVAGWPLAILFQGSLFSSALDVQGTKGQPFGAYYQALLIKELLDGGYAVLAPEAHAGGSTFWDTNVPPWDVAWSGAPDDIFMTAIFAAIGSHGFGPLDGARMYATGISSGGYMTSRMAVSYAGRFKSLAIASASYASCSGGLCNVPKPLPVDHPPTLFLHGQQDNVVPIATMESYRDELASEGHAVKAIIDPTAGHEWIAAAPDAVLAWFDASP